MANTLYFVRHLPTLMNGNEKIPKMYCGNLDLPLFLPDDPRPVDEIRAAYDRIDPDVVVLGGLKRHRQTYELMNPAQDKPLETMLNFMERNYGVLTGLPKHVAKNIFGEEVYPLFYGWKTGPKKGETYLQVASRVAEGVEAINKRYEDKKVLIVTSAGPIRAASVLLGDTDPSEIREVKPKNGQAFVFSSEIDYEKQALEDMANTFGMPSGIIVRLGFEF